MTNQYKYFIIAAEELNIKRAADRAFISPQGMSNAIKQLENELGVMLFHRVPKMTLTPEGEVLAKAAKDIQAIEDNMMRQLADTQQSYQLNIDIGIHSCSLSYLSTEIVPKFIKQYPHTTLNIVSDFTERLEQSTADGNLDLFVGDGQVQHENLHVIPLIEEKQYLIASHNLLEKWVGTDWKEKLVPHNGKYDYCDFIHMPLIQYPSPTRLGARIERYAESHDTILNVIYESNNIDTFSMLCHQDLGTAIVSEYHLNLLNALNRTLFADNPVEAFLLDELGERPDVIFLAYNKRKYITQCHRDLIGMIVRTMRRARSE